MSFVIFKYYNNSMRKTETPDLVQLHHLNKREEEKVEFPIVLKIQGKDGKFSQLFIFFKNWSRSKVQVSI